MNIILYLGMKKEKNPSQLMKNNRETIYKSPKIQFGEYSDIITRRVSTKHKENKSSSKFYQI